MQKPTLVSFLTICVSLCGLMTGCGSTKTSNTSRTGTEQLVISDAMDRAVSQVDFRALAGRRVYFDTKYLKVVDSDYLISLVRQHALASGCQVEDDKEKVEYIVEIRGGAAGTDQHDLLFGVPETSLPFTVPGMNISVLPEVSLAKKTTQKAVVKVGLFAYNVKTGRPVWQSGNLVAHSRARNTWVLGVGPVQDGEIYKRSSIAGMEMDIPLARTAGNDSIPVGEQAFFTEPPEKEIQVAETKTETPAETTAVAGTAGAAAPAPAPASAVAAVPPPAVPVSPAALPSTLPAAPTSAPAYVAPQVGSQNHYLPGSGN